MTKKVTTIDFIRRAKEVHGQRYDYSKAIYTRATAKVLIKCHIHGEFWQRAIQHTNRGHGCPECGKGEDFVTRAKRILGPGYNFDQTVYMGARKKVSINCVLHGSFQIAPRAILENSMGCGICENENRLSKFIEKARTKHGEKYDYSFSVMKAGDQEIMIVCPIHGEFKQNRSTHLSGSGCPECGKLERSEKNRLTFDEFVSRAAKIHKNRYDYKNVNYVNNCTKIEINCPDHGAFFQNPSDHLAGKGCKVCGRKKAAVSKTLSRNQFIKKAQLIHGDYFTYGEYTGMHNKIRIVCPKHGEFYQKAHNHQNGDGCPRCRNEKMRTLHAMSLDDFLSRVKKVWGNELDFSNVKNYVNSKTKIEVKCPHHGTFLAIPNNLIDRDEKKGSGCPECGRASIVEKNRMPLEQFLDRAVRKHGDFFSYKNVCYDNLKDKVSIICPKHGEFQQEAFSHIDGAGCPVCRSSRGEREIELWLKQNKVPFVRQWTGHDCIINTHPAKFDFYLPKQAAIIEFDGEQHFKPVAFFGCVNGDSPEQVFEKQKIIDFVKDDWAGENGFLMIRIAYFENVDETLHSCLKEGLLTI